jgi:phosphomannomutase
VNEWLTPTFDANTGSCQRITSWFPKELEESFYKDLEFGTGGMRGVMGVGNNRINKYTLGKVRKDFLYLHKAFPNQPLKAAIAYDCRHNSDTLAKLVADVFR